MPIRTDRIPAPHGSDEQLVATLEPRTRSRSGRLKSRPNPRHTLHAERFSTAIRIERGGTSSTRMSSVSRSRPARYPMRPIRIIACIGPIAPARECRRYPRPLAIFDGTARLRLPTLCPFKKSPGDTSAYAHHVPPQCGTGAGEYPTQARAVCAARNRRHNRQERSSSRSSFLIRTIASDTTVFVPEKQGPGKNSPPG